MDSVIKPKNKFPYVVYVRNDGLQLFYQGINPWLKENISPYCNRWYCPPFVWGEIKDKNGEIDNVMYFPYAFKNEEDVVAFKLRWS